MLDWEEFYRSFRAPGFIPGYELQNRLGGGAFGEVYKARKTSIGKAYAIKFLKVDDETQREVVQRELEQVRHFAAIDHPNLVSIEDMGSAMGVPYLVMGYAGEDTLARRLRRAPLELSAAVSFFVQTCRGVLALHDRRLVHFDLKPSNVFLKGDVARVGDYGLAKLLTDGKQTLSFGRGTPQYMAPEMLRGRADHRADIYSLGVMLYESVTGRLPRVRDDGGAARAEGQSDLSKELPPELVRITERCLHADPTERFASVEELLSALGQTGRQGDGSVFPAVSTRGDSAPAAPAAAGASPQGAAELARRVWEELRATRPGLGSSAATGEGASDVRRGARAVAQEWVRARETVDRDPNGRAAVRGRGPRAGRGLLSGGVELAQGLGRLLAVLVFMVALGALLAVLVVALLEDHFGLGGGG